MNQSLLVELEWVKLAFVWRKFLPRSIFAIAS
jgi:hypothetical protein